MTITIVMMINVGHPNIENIDDDDNNMHIEVHDDDEDNEYYSYMKGIVER